MADYQVQVPRDRYSLVRGVMSTWRASYYAELTPVEQRQGLWFKRDDYAAGGLGAKARAIEAIINANKPVQCVHTGGSRHSVQIVVAATVCKRLGVPLTCHVPTGQTTAETRAVVATGAKLVRHKPGYSSVLRKRAADYARAEGGLYVPPGLDSAIAVGLVAKQAANIPDSVERVVVCGGSGITAAGILLGTKGKGVTVVVIEVGASTRALIGKHAGCEAVRARILPPTTQYEKPHAVTTLYGVPLDPYYEAKCIPYVKNALEDEMLWVSANRVPQVQA
jgi:1-aminocyclopropane-1-carboxylate deaminase/D-cysteine desulfhydrase-like pyridoxal-dependent ACC family enzyme